MYITPRVLIHQEFTQLPVYAEFPLPAFIIGPNYSLTRYSDPNEKPFTALTSHNSEALLTGNSYIPGDNTVYDFPNIPAGGDVDHSYTKVFAEAIEAQYFPHEELSLLDMCSTEVETVLSPSGAPYPNKVRFPYTVLKTANGFSRSGCFSGRDVHVNDVISLTDNLGNTVKARVKALEAETATINPDLASTIGAELDNADTGVVTASAPGATTGVFSDANVDFSNYDVVGKYLTVRHVKDSPGVFKIIALGDTVHKLIVDKPFTQTQTGRTWHIGGVHNDESNAMYECESHSGFSNTTTNATLVASNTSTLYVGYANRQILADTYTATVTTPGAAGIAKFTVTSLNGAFSPQTDVSLNAGTLSIDNNGNNAVNFHFADAEGQTATFALNDTWSVDVVALVEPTNPTASGTYIGLVDMVYKLTVERGGAFYDGSSNASTCARIVITSSDIDTTSVVLPRGAGHSFAVGSYGVHATFATAVNNGGLVAGDSYYIPVTAGKLGAVTILDLAENLPTGMLTLASSITSKLSLTQKNLQIPEVRDILTDDRNWTQEDAYITINADITTYDAALVVGAQPSRLPITAARLFVEHRDLLQDHVVAIDSVRDLADVTKKLGTVHPDNPLAQGVYDAVLNSQNQIVYFIGVQTNDLAGYTKAIQISEKSDKVYSFVPLTFDRPIQDAVVSHVNAYSTAEVGRWRIAWLSVEDKKTHTIYDLKEDGTPYKATILDDPAVSGVQLKLLTIEGAKFIDDGIRPNDTIRIGFRADADGKVVYTEYVVDHVRTNTSLILTKPAPSAVTVPSRVEVIRNYTTSERATNIAFIGGEFNNRRVRCVFPDTYKYGGITKQGYFAAAGLAGLRSGVVPHQGLTNSEFLGADDLSKIVIEFSQDELNTMAEQGIWLITQEVVGATPYVRHQLTTDESGLNTSEDSITTNVDNISYTLKAVLAPYIGKYNVNPQNVEVIRAAVDAALTDKAQNTYTVRAGNQLVSWSAEKDILKIGQNALHKDRIDVAVKLNVPYPLNYIDLTLIVG